MTAWEPTAVLGAVLIDRATEREVQRVRRGQIVTVACHGCPRGRVVGRVLDADDPSLELWAPPLAPRSPDVRGLYWSLVSGPLPDEGTVVLHCFRCGHGEVAAAALTRAASRACATGSTQRVATSPPSTEVP